MRARAVESPLVLQKNRVVFFSFFLRVCEQKKSTGMSVFKSLRSKPFSGNGLRALGNLVDRSRFYRFSPRKAPENRTEKEKTTGGLRLKRPAYSARIDYYRYPFAILKRRMALLEFVLFMTHTFIGFRDVRGTFQHFSFDFRLFTAIMDAEVVLNSKKKKK